MSVNFIWAYNNFDKALIQARYASETMKIVSDLSYQLRSVILQQEKDLSIADWSSHQNRLTAHLSNKPKLTPVMNRFILGLERRYRSVASLELALIKNINTHNQDNKLSPIKRHLRNKLFLQIEAIREDTLRLSLLSQNTLEEVINMHGIGFLVIIIVFIFPITLSSSRLAKNINQSLRRLIKGTKRVIDGQFYHCLEGFRDDEFGVFAKHFNVMIAHLDETMISRDSLQEAVNERTKELQKLSEMDALTKIHNRRFYNHQITSDIATAKRMHQYLSLLMIDVDNFKGYNDAYGHDMGDVVLSNVANVIADALPRETDSVSRFGGEEFVVLLPSTDKEGAFVIAERIRSYIKALAIPHSVTELGILSVSIGMSSMASDVLNEIDLLKRADLALYQAKDNGRNQSVVFTEKD